MSFTLWTMVHTMGVSDGACKKVWGLWGGLQCKIWGLGLGARAILGRGHVLARVCRGVWTPARLVLGQIGPSESIGEVLSP